MSAYLSEHEQSEKIRALWTQYGHYALGVLLLGALLVVGWQLFDGYRVRQLTRAGMWYQQLLWYEADQKPQQVVNTARALAKAYPSNVYTDMALLYAAKASLEQKQVDQAKVFLDMVVNHGYRPLLRDVAALRLARLYAAEKKWAEAKRLVAGLDHSMVAAAVWEFRGDVAYAEGALEEARRAYQKAHAALPPQEPGQSRSLVMLKLSELPG